jgi:hypothetical protein
VAYRNATQSPDPDIYDAANLMESFVGTQLFN